jgi:hypothetical protein
LVVHDLFGKPAATFPDHARALAGTTEAPHFDRTAFKVRRIYATLAADGKTANLMLMADEQALKCALAPDAPVPNAWGARGATTAKLSALRIPQLQDALTIAWRHAVPNKPRRRR